MIRVRTEILVRYGHYNEVLENSRRLNELARKNGWAESRFWVSLAGQDNTLVVETDFDSLATYEKQSAATSGDAEYMRLIRSNIDHVVEGSLFTEIYEEAEPIA